MKFGLSSMVSWKMRLSGNQCLIESFILYFPQYYNNYTVISQAVSNPVCLKKSGFVTLAFTFCVSGGIICDC